MAPETRYAKTADGVHIAYQVRGDGPIDLVFIMGFTASFEIETEAPRVVPFFERLASFSRLILFDKRGTGLSDRDQTPDLERRAEDLRAVLDAVSSDRAVLLGHSEGGALGAFFAATYPDRVAALILYGSAARYARAPDYPYGMTPEERLEERERIERGWGSLEHARSWMRIEAPSWADDPEMVRWWAKTNGSEPRPEPRSSSRTSGTAPTFGPSSRACRLRRWCWPVRSTRGWMRPASSPTGSRVPSS